MVGKDLIMATLFGSGGGSSGSGGGEGEKSLLDAMIDGSITEISSNTVTSITRSGLSHRNYLTKIDFPNVVKIDESGLNGCTVLQTVNTPNAETLGSSAFSSCGKLTTITLPKAKSVAPYAFSYCSMLAIADFPVCNIINNQGFSECNSLKALILRLGSEVTLNNTNAFRNCYHMLGTTNATYNPDGLHDGYVYVPRSLLEVYPAATNWSALALQFRALEDYTVDGTITGDLDESKI